MTYLPFLLLTPLVWLVISNKLLRSGRSGESAALTSLFIVLALWGVLLLLTN